MQLCWSIFTLIIYLYDAYWMPLIEHSIHDSNIPVIAVGGCIVDQEYSGRSKTKVKNQQNKKYDSCKGDEYLILRQRVREGVSLIFQSG